jgi:hypothetical protein
MGESVMAIRRVSFAMIMTFLSTAMHFMIAVRERLGNGLIVHVIQRMDIKRNNLLL